MNDPQTASSPPSAFAEAWDRFESEFRSAHRRLVTELESCWKDLHGILREQFALTDSLAESAPTPESPLSLGWVNDQRSSLGQSLLQSPHAILLKKSPQRRAAAAIESYERDLSALLNGLPESLSVSPLQVSQSLGSKLAFKRRMASLRRKAKLLPLQLIVSNVFSQLLPRRLALEGEYLVTMTRLIRCLKQNWNLASFELDSRLAGQAISLQTFQEEKTKLRNGAATLFRQAGSSLDAWRNWQVEFEARLQRRVLSHVLWTRRARPLPEVDPLPAHLSHWLQQFRSVETEINLELSLHAEERTILSLFAQSLDTMSQEGVEIAEELGAFLGWIKEAAARQAGTPPSLKSYIVPSATRMSALVRAAKTELDALPESVEVYTAYSARPRKRPKLRMLEPAKAWMESFGRNGRPSISRVLQEVESHHKRTVQEMERAYEAVAFSLEEAQLGHQDAQVVGEVLQNAASLLEHSRTSMPKWRPSGEERIARALLRVFLECRLVLSQHRLSVWLALLRHDVGRAWTLVSQRALASWGKALQGGIQHTGRLLGHLLAYIGWRPAAKSGQVDVVTRPLLPDEFVADLSERPIPAIYRRLFRYEAIQDPRFLVGREEEMNAVSQARNLWERGRSVSVIIVGERGSGKTSLINCAQEQCLKGLEIVRGEFGRRLLSEADLHVFLGHLLGVADISQLEPHLKERRPVIILEELERSFLRQVGHYGAIRALQRVIAATCSSAFWMLAINQVAFRFLDASVRLGDSFSHRVNAATATSESLRQAILLRHNLSGLRLHFAAPPDTSRWPARVLRREVAAEDVFFERLTSESGGVFRTAFEIWLSHISSADAGVVRMKPLLPVDLSPVINALDTGALFTLVAILQHGGLTAEEHSRIFQVLPASSQAQLDELLAREIIEPDPGRDGLRVRPEAGRVVQEALYRRNLL
ncbi:MAG: ATP-binding protein [Acidobacteriota bacterium]